MLFHPHAGHLRQCRLIVGLSLQNLPDQSLSLRDAAGSAVQGSQLRSDPGAFFLVRQREPERGFPELARACFNDARARWFKLSTSDAAQSVSAPMAATATLFEKL